MIFFEDAQLGIYDFCLGTISNLMHPDWE